MAYKRFRLNLRRLVVHFGSPAAQRVWRAYSPGGAREVFFGKPEGRIQKPEPAETAGLGDAGTSRNRTARSVWSARSLLPLSGTRHRSKAPASWTHSKRFARQFIPKNPYSL